MAQNNSEEEFNELVTAFFQGRMTRRRFIHRAAQLGLSAALVSQIVPASFAAGDDFLESSPVAPNESPVTKERIEYLKSMPHKDTTINLMVLRSAVGDCVEYHAPRWEEETGAHVNIWDAWTDNARHAATPPGRQGPPSGNPNYDPRYPYGKPDMPGMPTPGKSDGITIYRW